MHAPPFANLHLCACGWMCRADCNDRLHQYGWWVMYGGRKAEELQASSVARIRHAALRMVRGVWPPGRLSACATATRAWFI